MSDKELLNHTYEEIEAITKKQTSPILLAIIGIIVGSFLYTNVPRVINTDFHDINSSDVEYIAIWYNAYSNEIGRYVMNFDTYYNDNDYNLDEILTVISKYDYKVRPKTFAGIQTRYDMGGNASLTFNVICSNSRVDVKLCENGDVWVDMIAYKMDSDEAKTLMTEIINWSGIDEIDEENDFY